jgi:hypothetical protein
MQHLHPQGDFKIEYISKYGISANGYKIKQYGTHGATLLTTTYNKVKQKVVTTTMNTNYNSLFKNLNDKSLNHKNNNINFISETHLVFSYSKHRNYYYLNSITLHLVFSYSKHRNYYYLNSITLPHP